MASVHMRVSEYVNARIGRSKEDFRVDHFTVGGPGGGGKDTSNTGVRITDKKTGITAECTEERSQLQNRNRAFERLATRLKDYYAKQELRDIVASQNNSVVRTYQERGQIVNDVRLSKTHNYRQVLDGKLDNLFSDLMGVQ